MKRLPTSISIALQLGPPIVLSLVQTLATPGAPSREAAAFLGNQSPAQAKSPEQSQSSSVALAEAARLSLTVVKLFNEGKYEEAVPLAKRALELRETVLGADDHLVQGALLNLAELYTAMKKYGDAEKLTERLVKSYEKKAGAEDAGVAIFFDKLAFLAFVQRDFSKSEAAYKRALAIRERVFGQDHAEFATSLYSLAEFYRFTGKFQKAQPPYEQAAILRRKLLGREHPDYLKAKERYFCVVFETLQEKKLKDFENRLGDTLGTKATGLDVLNGKAVSLPRPDYPEAARREHAQGVVVVKVTIDELGNVIGASDMCGGNPVLVAPTLEAARLARFTSTKVTGQAVKVTGVITYNFVVR